MCRNRVTASASVRATGPGPRSTAAENAITDAVPYVHGSNFLDRSGWGTSFALAHAPAPHAKGRDMDEASPTNRASVLRAHGFLVFLLCLIAANVAILVAFGDYSLDRYGNLVGALGLLFMHLAIRYAKTAWQRTAMWLLTVAWLGFAFAYLTWLFSLLMR